MAKRHRETEILIKGIQPKIKLRVHLQNKYYNNNNNNNNNKLQNALNFIHFIQTIQKLCTYKMNSSFKKEKKKDTVHK